MGFYGIYSSLVPEQKVCAVANPLLKKGVVVIFAGEQLKVIVVLILAGIHKALEGFFIIWLPLFAFLKGYAKVFPGGVVY